MADNVSPKQARQGRRGKPVLYVLIASLALMGVYMVGLLTWSGMTAPPDPGARSQAASRREVTGSINGQTGASSSAISSHVPNANPSSRQPATKSADDRGATP